MTKRRTRVTGPGLPLRSGHSRRGVLQTASRLAVAAMCGVPALLASRQAIAAKVPKAAVGYQPQPKDGECCADCRYFTAGSDGAPGQCELVQGEIAPEAWCQLFKPRS